MSAAEIERAAALRRQGLTWRQIGAQLFWNFTGVRRKVIARYPELTRVGRAQQALALREQGLTYLQIAMRLDMAESSARQAVLRARQQRDLAS